MSFDVLVFHMSAKAKHLKIINSMTILIDLI